MACLVYDEHNSECGDGFEMERWRKVGGRAGSDI